MRGNGVVGNGCLEWGPAFDEPVMIAAGCEEINQAKTGEVSLIQLYKLEGNKEKGTFVQYGNDLFPGHTGSLQDLSWAPLHGRSFHLLVSAASDH